MQSDLVLHDSAHHSFRPHAHTSRQIRDSTPRTDWFWIVDADEIYDPETVPAALRFVENSSSSAILVRGFNFFRKWNYMIDPLTDYFCHIGFLRPGNWFYQRRNLYIPRILGGIGRFSPRMSRTLIDLYRHQSRMPEGVAHFYHGSYIGDDERIRSKVMKSSHYRQLAPEFDEWFESSWKTWTPESRDFWFPYDRQAMRSVRHVPTSELPTSISQVRWPEGWLDPVRDRTGGEVATAHAIPLPDERGVASSSSTSHATWSG